MAIVQSPRPPYAPAPPPGYGMPPTPGKLASDRVVLSSTMSFSGSAKRIWNVTKTTDQPVARAALAALAVFVISLVWIVVAGWYVVAYTLFLPFTIIMRAFGRGRRNAKRGALQHHEMLAALTAVQTSTVMAGMQGAIPYGARSPDGMSWWNAYQWVPIPTSVVEPPDRVPAIQGPPQT